MKFPALPALLLLLSAAPLAAQSFFPIPETTDPARLAPYVARTAGRLQAPPSPTDTVRVVVYGQSISMQDWWKDVKSYLEAQYPRTPLVVLNRAIGGFSAERLKLMVANDLVPLAPDLVLFHDYGNEADYETIIRTIRERTTAEVAVQTDHVAVGQNEAWHDRHNGEWLPALCQKYNLALLDVRTAWKAYLQQNNLPASALLTDGVHLNAHGNYLMAGIVKRYLAALPQAARAAPSPIPVVYRAGNAYPATQRKLRLPVEGNRVDLVWAPGSQAAGTTSGSVTVRIDGKKPSARPDCYFYTRPARHPEGFFLTHMGQLLAMQLAGAPQEEDWTLTVTAVDTARGQLRFTLRGSRTGEDGVGRSDSLFTSRSGRIVITPEGWFRRKSPGDFGQFRWLAPGDRLGWQVKCMGRDVVTTATPGPVTVVGGIPNGRHVLELEGQPLPAEVRVYKPQGF
ncbi:MAG: hypothetical protein ICV83_10765 [Cytophagales bacterium]|nr:hypothetical protein [Cytophagales bacterium]